MPHECHPRSRTLIQTINQDLGPMLDTGFHGAAWHEGKADIHVMNDLQDSGILFLHGHGGDVDEWLTHAIRGHTVGAIITPHLFVIATAMLPTLMDFATQSEMIVWVGRAGEDNDEAGCGGPPRADFPEILERARGRMARTISRDELREHIEEVKEIIEDVEPLLAEALEPGGLVDVTAEAHRVTTNIVGTYLANGFYGAPHEGDDLSDLHALPIISAGMVTMHPHHQAAWQFLHDWTMNPSVGGASPFVYATYDDGAHEDTGEFLVSIPNWPLVIQAAKLAGVVIYMGPEHR